MCTVCGCGGGGAKIGTAARRPKARPVSGKTVVWRPVGEHEHEHVHLDGTRHSHPHEHPHDHDHAPDEHEHVHLHADGTRHSHAHSHPHDHTHGEAHAGVEHVSEGAGHMHFGTGPAHAHVPGMSQSQMLKIEQDILGKNGALAAISRREFAARGIFALNLVSSPGSGKTSLLVRTIRELADRVAVTVIEGDQQTEFDAERIRETGVPALQINTGKGCHLDADMVARGLRKLAPADDSLLLIENVGNLVCPAAFDLGEAHKVAILSVTEGEDKPLKYPDMFAAADLMLLNKIDLLPYLDFDTERAIDYARRVNPALVVIRVSARTGEGFDEWLAWIDAGLQRTRRDRSAPQAR